MSVDPAIFEQVGGPDWQTDLVYGGVTVIVALALAVLFLTIYLVTRRD